MCTTAFYDNNFWRANRFPKFPFLAMLTNWFLFFSLILQKCSHIFSKKLGDFCGFHFFSVRANFSTFFEITADFAVRPKSADGQNFAGFHFSPKRCLKKPKFGFWAKKFSVTNWKFQKLFLSIMLTIEKSIFGCKNCIPFLFFWTKKNVQFWKNENRFVKQKKNRCEHHAHKPKIRRCSFVTENVIHSQLHFSNFDEERVGNTEKWKKKLTMDNIAKIDCEHNAQKSFFRWIFLLLRNCYP